MSIERECKNCAKESGCPECDCNKGNNYEEFAPKEELVRADERSKVLATIIEDLTNSNNDIAITKEDGTTYMVKVTYLFTHKGINKNEIIISN